MQFKYGKFNNFTGLLELNTEGTRKARELFWGAESWHERVEGLKVLLDDLSEKGTIFKASNGGLGLISGAEMVGNVPYVHEHSQFWTTHGQYSHNELIFNLGKSGELQLGEGKWSGRKITSAVFGFDEGTQNGLVCDYALTFDNDTLTEIFRASEFYGTVPISEAHVANLRYGMSFEEILERDNFQLTSKLIRLEAGYVARV